MKRYFEYKDGASCKFWEVTLQDNTLTVRFGKIGTNGSISEKQFDSADKAQKECEKLIRQKTGKGYVEVLSDDPSTSAGEVEVPQQKQQVVAESTENRPTAFSPFKLVGAEEFRQKYFKQLKLFRDAKELFGPDHCKYYIVCDGNAFIEGHLRFSDPIPGIEYTEEMAKAWGYSIDETVPRVVVLGDLVIQGSLINYEEYEPLLYVKGNLYADNILSGNSHIYVNGDSRVRDVFCGYYNDGSFISRGILQAMAYVDTDHNTYFKKRNVKWKWSNINDIGNAVKRKILRPDITEISDIAEVLAEGENVLTATGDVTYTYEQWLERVMKKGKKLQAVPENMRDRQMCLTAISSYAEAFPLVPSKLKDRDFCLEALRLNPMIFEYLYNDYGNDREFCEVAVTGKGSNLRFVPFSMITKELARLAIDSGADLKYIPANLLDEDMVCQAVVVQKGSEYVPQNFYTRRVLTECMAYGDFKVPYRTRPEDFYNSLHLPLTDMIKEVVGKGIQFIENIPDYLFSRPVYEHAEQLYGQGDTREEWERLKERHAVVPGKLKHWWASHREGGLFGGYWRVYWTREFCENFIFNDTDWDHQPGDLLLYVPREWITHEMAALALKNIHNAVQIPACAMTEDMCMQILQRESLYCIYQKELYTHRVCYAGMGGCDPEYGNPKSSGYSLKEIPYEMRTFDICEVALRTDQRAWPYIPESFRADVEKAVASE